MPRPRMTRALGTAFAVLFLALPSTALGQLSRTWISASGSDSNDCSQGAPCASWNGALAKTAAGGEIDALDSGAYGSATIDKSITLDGAGVHAGAIIASDGIVVNNPSAKVVIRGVVMNGARELGLGYSGNFGVNVFAARVVRLEDVRISDFSRAGIRFAPSNPGSRMTVIDSTIADNIGYGVAASPSTSGATGSVNRLTLRDVTVTGNGVGGVSAEATGATGVVVSVFDSLIADNAADGIRANGARAKQRISNNEIVANGQGLRALNGGNIASWGNNRVFDNGIDGAPTVMANSR